MTATRSITIRIILPARERTIALPAPPVVTGYVWLSPDAVCEKLGISRTTLTDWNRKGRLAPDFKDGRVVLYREDRVDAALSGSDR